MSKKNKNKPNKKPSIPSGNTTLAIKPKWQHILIIVLIASVVRVAFLVEFNKSPYASEKLLMVDAKSYDTWGQNIANGDIIGNKVFYQSPLYPYFLGFVYKLFGHSLFVVRLIQIIIGVLCCCLIYLIGAKVFNRMAGIISMFISALYGTFIFQEQMILKSVLVIFFELLLFYCLLSGKERSFNKHLFLGGVLSGLLALLRGNVIFFFPFVLIWIYFHLNEKWDKNTLLKKFILPAGIYMFGIFIIIFPVTVRNYLISKDIVLINYTGGINFFIGNNPETTGIHTPPTNIRTSPEWEEEDARVFAEKSEGRKLKPSEISRFWFRKGLTFIKENPGRFIKNTYKKFSLFWNNYEVPDNYNYYFTRDNYSKVLKMPLFSFAVIASLGIVGMFLYIKSWKKGFLFYSFIIVYMLSTILFYINSRYRLPVVPFLIIFAGYSVYSLYERMKDSNYKSSVIIIISILLVWLFCNKHYFSQKYAYYREYGNLGNYYSSLKEYDLAFQYFEKSLIMEKSEPGVYYNYGLAKKESGNILGAVQLFHETLHLNSEFILAKQQLYMLTKTTPHWEKGVELYKNGLLEQAIIEFEKEVKVNPYSEIVYNELGNIYHEQKSYKDAIIKYKKSIEINPYFTKALNNIGIVYFKMGLKLKAREAWNKSLSINSRQPLVRKYIKKE